MHQGYCAAVSRGSRISIAQLALALVLAAGCSAILDPDRDKLATRPSGAPGDDGGTLPDGGDGDGDGDGDAGGGDPPDDLCEPCDDGIACTIERCEGELCVHQLDDQACAADERCHLTKGCIPVRCRDATDCNDGDPCNGTESCNPGGGNADVRTGCATGREPDCDDRIDCTIDACETGTGCVHAPDHTVCADDVECTIDECDTSTGCQNTESDARCDACTANAVCNGVFGCLGGGLPRSCDDGDMCTEDSCSVELGMCVYEPAQGNGCNPEPDTCAEARAIELDGNGLGQASGSLLGATATYDTSCGANGARDAVYVLQIDDVSDVILDTSGSDAGTVLAVARTCSAAGFGFACAAAVGPSEPTSRLVLHRYDPALHGSQLFVLVDGADTGETGDYLLNVRVTPVASDDCAAEPLALDGCGTVIGFMDSKAPADRWGQLRGPCQGGGDAEKAPEAVVLIPGAADGTVSLVSVSDAFTPVLYARTFCDSEDNDDQLGCEVGGAQSGQADFTISLPEDEAAFVIVDGGEDGARFALRCVP
jgi:hypothetical protein